MYFYKKEERRKKKDAILFRMDNRVVQVIFNDKRKVIVNFSTKQMLITKSLFEKGIVYEFEGLKTNKEAAEIFDRVKELLNELSQQ